MLNDFDRVVLSTSSEWGAVVTKLNVPGDWKGISFNMLMISINVDLKGL